MTDTLIQKLTSVIDPLAPVDDDNLPKVYLSEAETDDYPYVVFDITSSPLRDKDGVYGFRADTKIRVVGNSFNVIDPIQAGIQDAIEDEMNDGTFSARLLDATKECVDGIWTVELNYTLKQYADWEPETETND